MTQRKFKLHTSVLGAILNTPDTELKDIFLEGLKLLEQEPSILYKIDVDIDSAAKEKKALRLADQKWFSDLNGWLPGCEEVGNSMVVDPDKLLLFEGRPRLLDPESVFLLMLCRAHLDSVTSKQAVDRLKDSILIQTYFEARGMRLPAANTVLDNINAVTNETRDYIFKSQMGMIMKSGLDSMELVTVDSFSVAGNTEWPTDSRILLKLLQRAYHVGRTIIPKFGLPGFTIGCVPRWLKELSKLEFEIANTCSKPKSKKKIKKLYRRFLKRVNKSLLRMIRRFNDCLPAWEGLCHLPPSKRMMAQAAIDRIILDLENVIRVYTYAGNRVFHGITLPSPEKVLSLSDECVSFIKKGGRDAVVGYKPQVVRSGEGFITAFELYQGNPADAARAVPVIQDHCKNTDSIPQTAAFDDGYSSQKNMKALKGLGIGTVAIGGSKGKKVTPDMEWDSPEHQDARNARSAVESIIFVLRYKFHLESFTRRGLEGVTAELTEKVIAHNFWRIAYLKKKQRLRLVA